MYVAISNLNCGNVPDGCEPPPGNGPNCSLLHDNKDPQESSFQKCKLDAYSLPFTTEQEIQSYEWYHFKLAIGDAADNAYDSGVLLEKGSIVSIPVPDMALVECENEQDVVDYVDNVLLSGVLAENKANITFQGDPQAVGYFNNTEFLNLDANSGVFLSNGLAGNALLPNECDESANASTDNEGLQTDQDLELLAGEIELGDVSIIEFDYKPSNDTIRFNYVFASEEYHELIDAGYFDVFGIFLSGPGIEGEFSNGAVNLAVLPDDDSPVNSSTVNFGLGDLTCQGKPDGCYHCEYLIDNSQKTDTAFFAMAYDAYTISMDAVYPAEPGEWYHIKIAIGDALTENHDSGIFLSEGTLVSDSIMTSVSEFSFSDRFRIHPNPSNDFIEVQNFGNIPIIAYSIYDINGRRIRNESNIPDKISLTNMPKGILILELSTGNRVYRQKFLHK